MIRISLLFIFLITISCLWLTSAGLYLNYRVGLDNLLTLNPSDLAIYICATIAPIAILWLITGFTHHIFATRQQNNLSTTLLYQARRSSEHTEALVKAMIDIQDQTRSGVLLQNISLAMNHLNEIMSQIALRFGILTNDASERLWEKVNNGNIWAFCRVIIDNAERTTHFNKALLRQALKDKTLASAITEFCKRFENLQYFLSIHDRENFIADIVEEGSLGKVFDTIKPVMVELDINSEKEKTLETIDKNSELEPINKEAKDLDIFIKSDEEKYSFFKKQFEKKENDEDEETSTIKASIKKIEDVETDTEEVSNPREELPNNEETIEKNDPQETPSSDDKEENTKNEPEEKKSDFTFFGWRKSEPDNEKKTSKLPRDGI